MRGCEKGGEGTAARQEEDFEEEAAVEVEPWSSKDRLDQERPHRCFWIYKITF